MSRPSGLRWVAASTREEALAALGIVTVNHRCAHCGSTVHGQPWSPEVGGLSISVVDGCVLAARGDASLGIDHERVSATVADEVVRHPKDRGDALRLWVRKEAVLKATGQGLRVDPRSFWIDRRGRARSIPGYDGPPVAVQDIHLDGHVASLAYVLSQN